MTGGKVVPCPWRNYPSRWSHARGGRQTASEAGPYHDQALRLQKS
jgi:hypothetical protein